MSEHTRRSPYEPEKNDGSERNSRKDPAELKEATPAVETLPDDENLIVEPADDDESESDGD